MHIYTVYDQKLRLLFITVMNISVLASPKKKKLKRKRETQQLQWIQTHTKKVMGGKIVSSCVGPKTGKIPWHSPQEYTNNQVNYRDGQLAWTEFGSSIPKFDPKLLSMNTQILIPIKYLYLIFYPCILIIASNLVFFFF